tara:strand:+ start:163 stop:2139 length:1977 start_codon:yes stop_codon:yes gene_type:complete
MATYDIGAGISEALGSIGQGLVTRKERKEERERVLGQAQMIEDDLYSNYQNLLDTGASEGQVKEAQKEYEKWANSTSEDESTKKIEGMLQEYDKGIMRKSRRLQNRQLELQNELAETTNPLSRKTKEAELTKITNANEEFVRKKREREALSNFPAALDAYLNEPVKDTRDAFDVINEEQSFVVPPSVEDMSPYLSEVGQSIYSQTYKPAIEQGLMGYEEAYERLENYRKPQQITSSVANDLSGSIYDPASGFGVPKSSPRGQELLKNANLYGMSQDPGTGMELPSGDPRQGGGPGGDFPQPTYRTETVPRPFTYDENYMRQPTAGERSQRAQEFLTQQSTQLGPENRAVAEQFVQSRFPREIPGARITLDGKDTGKYIAGGQVLTERQQQNLMGIDSAPKGTYFKGLQGAVDPETGQVKYTYNYGIGEDPRSVGFVEDAVNNYADLTFKSKLASSEQEAKDFRTLAADAEHGAQIIDEVLKMDDEMGFFSRRVPLPLNDATRARVQSKLNVLRGKLRLAIIGPGAVSEYEQKILEQVIGNPTKMFQIEGNTRARLESLKSMMLQGMKFKGEQIGIWDYNHKMKPGAKKSDKRRTDYTPQELEEFDRNVAGRNISNASDIPSERAFNSAEQANASGLPSGTTVFVKDPARRALVEYRIP